MRISSGKKRENSIAKGRRGRYNRVSDKIAADLAALFSINLKR
jgi:hypothetical protein